MQKELAEKFCTTKPLISMYENDKVDIKGSIIVEIAELLGTATGYLLNREVLEERDSFELEILQLLKAIESDQMKQVALAQMKALVSLS